MRLASDGLGGATKGRRVWQPATRQLSLQPRQLSLTLTFTGGLHHASHPAIMQKSYP